MNSGETSRRLAGRVAGVRTGGTHFERMGCTGIEGEPVARPWTGVWNNALTSNKGDDSVWDKKSFLPSFIE